MTLRIPAKTDRDTQAAFQEIEDRLWKLEQAVKNKTENTEAVDELRDEMKRALTKPTHLDFTDVFRGGAAHALGYVPDPGYESSGMTKVLRSDGSWGQGLVQEVPWRYNAGNLSYAGTSSAQRVVSVSGSLAVTGSLQADTVLGRQNNIRASAANVYHNTNQTYSQGEIGYLVFNSNYYDSSAFHNLISNTGRLTVPTGLGGIYLIGGCVYQTFGGNPATANLRIRKDGSTVIGLTQDDQDASAAKASFLTIVCIDYLAAGSFVELAASCGGAGTATVTYAAAYSPNFWMVRIGS